MFWDTPAGAHDMFLAHAQGSPNWFQGTVCSARDQTGSTVYKANILTLLLLSIPLKVLSSNVNVSIKCGDSCVH